MSSNELKAGAVTLEGGQVFEVRGSRVLIECESDGDTYGSGIIKPEDYKRYSKWGTVRQIGNECKFNDVSIGDRVCYDCYSGQDIELNGVDFKIINPDNILCKMGND